MNVEATTTASEADVAQGARERMRITAWKKVVVFLLQIAERDMSWLAGLKFDPVQFVCASAPNMIVRLFLLFVVICDYFHLVLHLHKKRG